MLLYLFYEFARRCCAIFPRAPCVWVARRIADAFFLFDRGARNAVISNLAHVLSYKGVDTGTRSARRRIRWLSRETFENFAIHIVDFLRIEHVNTDLKLGLIRVEHFERFRKALSRNRGVISTTAHIGNWEVGAAVTANMGCPVYGITMRQSNPRIDRFFSRLREAGGIRPLPTGKAARGIFRALRRNHIVGLVADRDVDGSGIPVKFFGKEIKVPRGPAEIAVLSGASVVPAFLIQTESGLSKLIVEEPIEVDEALPVKQRIARLNKRIVEVIERYVARYPTQWFAFYRVWG